MPKSSFIQTVQTMSAHDIIMAMVEGLRNPVTKIRMSTFGSLDRDKDNSIVCYGCAATNTICKLAGIKNQRLVTAAFRTRTVLGQDLWGTEITKAVVRSRRIKKLETAEEIDDFLDIFEQAIDNLRQANVSGYNTAARQIGVAQIKYDKTQTWTELPYLNNNYTEEDLQVYQRLAKEQLS